MEEQIKHLRAARKKVSVMARSYVLASGNCFYKRGKVGSIFIQLSTFLVPQFREFATYIKGMHAQASKENESKQVAPNIDGFIMKSKYTFETGSIALIKSITEF